MFSISEMPSPSSMFSISEMPSPSSMFSAYASVSASVMLCRTMVNELIPQPIRNYLYTKICYLFKPHTPYLTLVIEESTGMNPNQVFDAASTYLCTIINPKTKRLKVSKSPKEKNLTLQLDKGENLVDFYKEIELHWKLVCAEQEQSNPRDVIAQRLEKHKYFELSFLKKHKDLIIASYLPFILEKAKAIKDEKKVLKMHTLSNSKYSFDGRKWESVNLEHPATFETLAMDLDLKNSIMEDLNRFLKRKDFYKRVGRAWKRGYLLYGPPGTGKSSLVAAMANYLKFDIYDLQLASIIHDSELRRLLLSTSNRSILVIEDIDCSIEIPERGFGDSGKKNKKQDHQDSTPSRAFLTLSGLLNFVDGLWSSCGDERIIIFTTNHKDRLDPALLRPGRMDMHIHMSYCTFHGFKVLASNYLEINDQHNLFGEIESLMKETEVTPAQVTEELMKSEVADIALEGVVKLLKRKKLEDDNCEGIKGKKLNANRNVKRQKVEIKRKVPVRISRRKGTNLRRIKLQ